MGGLSEEINQKYLAQLHLSTATYSKFSQTSANNGKTYLKSKAYKQWISHKQSLIYSASDCKKTGF